MGRQRIDSIDLLRVMAMLMVVLVHATAPYLRVLPGGSGIYQSYHLINWTIRIEAGIFIMIAALVFFYKYINIEIGQKDLVEYYKKRALYIVLPYLMWALFYEFYSLVTGARELNFLEMTLRILQGESFYQLHFIFQIVQLYLVFPLFLYAAQRFSVFRKYMWVFGISIEAAYHIISEAYPPVPVHLFLGSLGTYFLGGWIGIYYHQLKKKIYNSSTMWWLLTAGLFCGLFVYLSYYIYTYNLHYFTRGYYLVFHMLFLVTGSYFLFRMTEIISERLPNILPYVRNIAMYSFGFYLLHPFILKVVTPYIPVSSDYWFNLAILLRYSITVLLCYFIIWGVHKFFPYASVFFGKLPRRARFITHNH